MKPKACPLDGETWAVNVAPLPLTTQPSVDRPRAACSKCGLPVALFKRVGAAMECARIVDDSTLSPYLPKQTRDARRRLARLALKGVK
mgnify:CR=1 FL=1